MTVTVNKVHRLAEELSELATKLESMVQDKEESLDNAESAERPNVNRIDLLQDQCQILSDAFNDLENAVHALEDYS